MGFLMVAFLSFYYLSFGPKSASSATFDVTSYGAIGDGNTDDADAFVRAWSDLCKDTSEDPTLIIPQDKTFLISCVSFNGPCSSTTVRVNLLGNITAPKSVEGWKGCDHAVKYLMYFGSVHGLTVDGPGQIDGQGAVWWPKSDGPTCDCPSMLRFIDCVGLRLSGTTHINSPKSHVSLKGCQDAEVGNIRISTPGDTPNTDGIDISSSSHVLIHDSVIECGDDCVAINGGTYDINITGVTCGPGHGISIGSLGKDGGYPTVEKVNVQNCNISGTQNGVRIKTVPYSNGYARGIVFDHIYLTNVGNPIVIDQHYCRTMGENRHCPVPPTAPNIRVSNVTYLNIYGSSATQQAIAFDCAGRFKCEGIVTDNVNITGQDVVALCENTEGTFTDTNPPVTCT